MKLKLPEELNFLSNSRKKQFISTEDMTGKLSVVSGSSSGIGLETIKRFAKAGSDIVMVVRNKEKAEKLANQITEEHNVKIDIIVADFSDFDTVREAAKKILESYKKIDVLVNSVGIHSTRRTYNRDGIEKCFAVNHLGIFLFTYLLLDRMKESAPSRIVQVNSEGHRFKGINPKNYNFKRSLYTGLRGYGQSKSAQLLTTIKFARLLEGSGVTINAMHPGAVKSNIGQNNGFLYRFFFRHFTWYFLKDASISGDAIYYLCTDPKVKDISGKFFNLTIPEIPAKHARKESLIDPVWDLSLQLTKRDN